MNNSIKQQPIGLYDSGIGGISVLSALLTLLPKEQFIYLGDTANLPYGNKSKQQLIGYTSKIISWFQNEIGAKLVIAACHTSSAIALDAISNQFHVPLIGMIRPLARSIANNATCKKIGIIATPASASSRAHEHIFRQHSFTGKISTISCPMFVPLIELNQFNPTELANSTLKNQAKTYLRPFFEDKELDTLIYGCSHYPLIRSIIESLLPSSVRYIDPSYAVALEAQALLSQCNTLSEGSSNPAPQFYCSHAPTDFAHKLWHLCGIKTKVRLSTRILENNRQLSIKYV